MNKLIYSLLVAVGIAMVTTPALARHGADDGPGHIRQSRGADDVAGHRSASSSSANDVRQCRGCDDPAGHVRQGRGRDDAPGHERHSGNDDGPNHQ